MQLAPGGELFTRLTQIGKLRKEAHEPWGAININHKLKIIIHLTDGYRIDLDIFTEEKLSSI